MGYKWLIEVKNVSATTIMENVYSGVCRTLITNLLPSRLFYLLHRKPKKGVSYLIDAGILEEDPESICKFLREEPGINKQKVGEYLGDLRNALSMHVLQ